MRISQEEKTKICRRIVRAAVDLIGASSMDQVSMRQIAKAAKISDATIHRYFSNKMAIVYAYFDLSHEETLERLRILPEFEQAPFIEQMQIIIYTQLDLFERDRAFVKESYKAVLSGGFLKSTEEAVQLKDKGRTMVIDLMESAVAAGEFADPPGKQLICSSLLDFIVGIGFYWLQDESKGYQNTLQMVDKSLAVVNALLKSNILGSIADVIQFLFREHIVSQWSSSNLHHFDFGKIKQRFKEQI